MKLPKGLYEQLITSEISAALGAIDLDSLRAEQAPLDPVDSYDILARHVHSVLNRVLRAFAEHDRLDQQVDVCNRVLTLLAERMNIATGLGSMVQPPASVLLSISEVADNALGEPQIPGRPHVPLSASDLLVNARGEPSVGHALEREIPSADRIDLLCAFVRWNGLRLLLPQLRAHCKRGRELHVITTTYTGSTERRALDALVEMGGKVKVSYETRSTRLHAKAWLFSRETGFSTAYIGSSNLTQWALVDGVEWNVRLSQVTAPDILEKFQATFDSYWEEADFESYDPLRDAERFDRAVASTFAADTLQIAALDVIPYPQQTEILERLSVERERHHRYRSLVVAATGTGKTIVAALDYRRLREQMGNPTLLFVAHRKELLGQSLAAFRQVLRDGAFGELYVDGHRPDEWHHVFASVQSLAQLDLPNLRPDAFDVVIVDEFHHAAAETYSRLLDHLRPKILLGLTATPERADGRSILGWFDGRVAIELRLWEALERGLLCPFHYFGLHDNTDLSHVTWSRRGYDVGELQKLYTGNHGRAGIVAQAIQDKVFDPRRMRALGFCVSIAHAEFMAREFNSIGLPSAAISSQSTREERDDALRKLRTRDVNILFAVDLFNEGVDVPEIDTVLFLRPTESATVFLQQLGRGLRQTQGKSCLTVLDFIGNANQKFRFDQRYRALTETTGADDLGNVREAAAANRAVTFAEQSERWLHEMQNRKRDPVKPRTLGNWKSHIAWLLPRVGDIPLSDLTPAKANQLITAMAKEALSAKTIKNYFGVFTQVIASAKNDKGEELYPYKWDPTFLDLPKVTKSKQRRPTFTTEVVEKIISLAMPREAMLYALLAGTGLRVGEALGLEIQHFVDDSLNIEQSLWNGKTFSPKTDNGVRPVDLPHDLAQKLRQFIGVRRTGYIFQAENGSALHQSNLLRRRLHPILKGLGIEK